MSYQYPFVVNDNIAIVGDENRLTYRELHNLVYEVTDLLKQHNISRVAIKLDNSTDWVISDLACQVNDCVCVPVPLFFSKEQVEHLLQSAAIELLISSTVESEKYIKVGNTIWNFLPQASNAEIPVGTTKITFTSGSTGTPKGVCLSTSSQLTVADSLYQAIGLREVRHLSLLPLSLLLENIAGTYAPLLSGGTVYLHSAKQRGFSGSQLVHPERMLELISLTQPQTLIVVPELLQLLVVSCQRGWNPPASLRFIAVGGANVDAKLLLKSHELGLPVYQGYGLSECCSVVALNTESTLHHNTVGKPLAHNNVTIEAGEIVVKGSHFLGYLNQPETFYPKQVNTGDLGKFENNELIVNGRSKNLLITSMGRNISPEWIEARLLACGLFQQAIVVGDSKPHCGALLVPLSASISREQTTQAISQINLTLPDYAHIVTWTNIAPLTIENGLLTATGKPKRAAIASKFNTLIHSLYSNCVIEE